MNKFLITTAIAASFVVNEVNAEIEASVKGSIDAKLTNVDQREKFRYKSSADNTKTKLANGDITTDAYLNFNIKGRDESGLKYGGLIKLNANALSKQETACHHGHKASITEQVMTYVESSYGKVEVGNYTGVTESMKVNAGTFANATGGINGDAQDYWNTSTVQDHSNNNVKIKTKTALLQTPNLPINELGTFGLKGVNAAKINYYTPECSGFRFGGTFIPSKVTTMLKDKEGFKNVFETGVSYTSEIRNIGLKLAFISEFGKNQNSDKKNLRAYELGTNLSYQGFTFGASYSDWGKYNAVKTTSNQYSKTSYWTAGLGYKNGSLSTSLTHLQGKKDTADANNKPSYSKLRNTVLGLDYKLSSGISPYAEFSSFKMNQPSDDNNKGHILMTGLQLTF